MDHYIRYVREHIEVYDYKTNKFLFSADNHREVAEGIAELHIEQLSTNKINKYNQKSIA